MLSDPVRIADAINNATFVAGDEVVLSQGPHKYKQGIYLGLKDDVEWAAIEESNGTVSSHPVEWMSRYREPLSYYSLTGSPDVFTNALGQFPDSARMPG